MTDLVRMDRTPTVQASYADLADRPLPLYKSIKAELTRTLIGGSIRAGMALPTERGLAQIYGVSVGTVRRALLELVSEKVLVREQGRGTFLAPFDSGRMLNSFWHIRRKDGDREAPVVRIVSFAKGTAGNQAVKRLAISRGAPVFCIVNLMMMGGEPVLVDNLQVPSALFPSLTRERFATRDATVYDLYRDDFGVNIVKTTDHVSAVAADAQTAKLLNRKVGTPLLEIVRVAYTFGEQPVELRRSLLNSENYEFVDVTGGDPGH